MNELYELKEMLLKELEQYGSKGELTAGSLDVIDKMTHTVKNLCKIIEDMEAEGMSGAYPMMNGNTYGRGYGGNSYARGRGYSRTGRDSMGRYSSNGYSRSGNMVDRLEELMADAPDDRTREELQRVINKMDSMR